jgi:hypothetical protein
MLGPGPAGPVILPEERRGHHRAPVPLWIGTAERSPSLRHSRGDCTSSSSQCLSRRHVGPLRRSHSSDAGDPRALQAIRCGYCELMSNANPGSVAMSDAVASLNMAISDMHAEYTWYPSAGSGTSNPVGQGKARFAQWPSQRRCHGEVSREWCGSSMGGGRPYRESLRTAGHGVLPRARCMRASGTSRRET